MTKQTKLPKLDVRWTPFSDAERSDHQTQMAHSNGPAQYDSGFVNELIGRYEAALAQYEVQTIDVELADQFAREHGVQAAYDLLRRWNAGLETQKRQYQDLCLKAQGERDDAERRLTHYLNDVINVPDGTFLQQLAGEIRGWGRDETGPTDGYAKDVADSLEDLAVAISREGRAP